MLDFEGKIIEPKYRDREILTMSGSDEEFNVSKVNIMPEDDALVERISKLSVNDGGAQLPPENTCYNESKIMALNEISS